MGCSRSARPSVWSRLAGALGVAGAAALGGAIAHASCPMDDARHWLLGHAGAPLAGVAVGLPLGVLPARWRARRIALR